MNSNATASPRRRRGFVRHASSDLVHQPLAADRRDLSANVVAHIEAFSHPRAPALDARECSARLEHENRTLFVAQSQLRRFAAQTLTQSDHQQQHQHRVFTLARVKRRCDDPLNLSWLPRSE
jgi:hypothetical protein